MIWVINPNSCIALRIIALHELRRQHSALRAAIDAAAGHAIMLAIPLVYPPMNA
jgi:hypothetical protein